MTTNLVKFKRGETVEIYAEVKTQAGVLTDPTTITVNLTDSAVTAILAAASMTKLDTGKYQYFYTLDVAAPLGFWSLTVTETEGTGGTAKVTKTDDGFEVEA